MNRGNCSRVESHRGMAVIVVLAVIAVTMSLAYAMVRTQITTVQIQSNSQRRDLSRHTAMTGINAALRHIQTQAWIDAGGVTSTFTGKISDYESYRVTFATGDPQLAAGDDDYDDYPYRVTLTATGTSVDPTNTDLHATHKIQAVVQLVPQQLADQPETWADMQQHDADTPYTVYQWGINQFKMHVPVQVKGAVHLQGAIRLCDNYPGQNSRPFEGLVDNVAIFDKALSDTQLWWMAYYGYNHHTSSLETLCNILRPVHWWKLNETAGATHAIDSTGGATGTYLGANPGSSGFGIDSTNRAAAFDGQHDRVDVGPINPASSAMTIVAWIMPTSFDAHDDGRIISKATGTDIDDHYWMLGTKAVDSTHRLRFRLRTDGWTKSIEAGWGDLHVGNRYFVAAVYDGSQMKLHLNGSTVGTSDKSGTIDTSATADVFIGENPPGNPRARYLEDLGAMHRAGVADYRPLTGPVYAPLSRTSKYTRSLITEELGATMTNVTATNSTPITHPGTVTQYRLYSGGKQYTIPAISSPLDDTQLGPHPITNPLGIVRCSGKLEVKNKVKFEGTLLTYGTLPDLKFKGKEIEFSPATLPSLEGDTATLHLPTAIVGKSFHVENDVSVKFNGMAIAWGNVQFKKGSRNTVFDMFGRLITHELKVDERKEWPAYDDDKWDEYLHDFMLQYPTIPYFPTWLETEEDSNLDPEPHLTIEGDSGSMRYHFPASWDDPIFVPKPNDNGEGLKWTLIRWTDDP
jgi:hypothetical protein